MPSNHPQPDRQQPDVLGLLAVCAFLVGAAVLVLDDLAGDVTGGHRTLLLAIGVICMSAAAVLVVAGPVRRHHRTPHRG